MCTLQSYGDVYVTVHYLEAEVKLKNVFGGKKSIFFKKSILILRK